MQSLSPEQVRSLRGDVSRATFARRVGVTPNTVYRWELPDGAAEARRPRGTELEKLARLLAGPSANEPESAAPVQGSSSQKSSGPTSIGASISLGASLAQDARGASPAQSDDLAFALVSVERVLSGEPRRGQSELVQLLAAKRNLSLNARALASFGIALSEIVVTGDPKSALIAISPALADAEADRLDPSIAARVFAVAALTRALPLAALFDHGYVHAFAARAEALAGGHDPETVIIGVIATLSAGMLVGDRELLERGYSRLEELPNVGLRPLVALHLAEFNGLRPMMAGKATAATLSFEALAEKAEQAGYTVLAARTLAHQAQANLDNLADPEQVLVLVRRARQMLGRTGHGVHHLLLARAEGEAHLRAGRPLEALAVMNGLEAWCNETGMPPLSAVPTWARVLHLSDRTEGFAPLMARLRDCDVAVLRPICRAYLAFLEATEAFCSSPDTALAVAAFERAEVEAKRWPFLLRHVMVHRILAHVVGGQEGEARLALRRAQRFMDSLPSPWVTAVLRRIEGTLLAAVGQWSEGRHLLQSTIATFESAGDRCDASLARYVLAAFCDAYEEPGAAAELAARRTELEVLGLRPPKAMAWGLERWKSKRGHEPEARSQGLSGVEALVVPLQRLSVRGALPSLILRELVAIAQELFSGRAVTLEEIDSTGAPRALSGPGPLSAGTAVEFSDGGGRSFRLSLAGEASQAERAALSVLASVAALSLETATLRGFDERRVATASDESGPEIAGFLAASPAMRRLRLELSRLAGSNATVIITGESGVGKEVVARAIHELSERAGKAYVAFNCATVPRELFEGQLFGYRRGAFTGASSDHAGVIRAATGGTLFLDEIGELPLDIQPKLLRFLENGEVFPLGERRPLRVDVRVLAATHRNLAELVKQGRFREDLYYRLQVVPIHVPPLRERREDVPVLARHFLRELTRHGDPPVLAPDALSALTAHDWPGNVRELRNVIERAMAFSPTPSVLRAEQLRIDQAPASGSKG